MPRAASAAATSGCSSPGSATAFPGRRFWAVCITSRSSSRPARSSSSQGWMSRTTAITVDARRCSDGAAEPGHGKSPTQQDQQQRAAGEGHGDLLLDLLGGQPGAEARVDLLELGGVGGLVEAAAADARDLLERLRVRRDLDARGQAERVAHLDLAVGRAERDREDRDAG